MGGSQIDAVLAEMEPAELSQVHWYLSIFIDWGVMTRAEADEWLHRIPAWEQYHALQKNMSRREFESLEPPRAD